MQSAALDFTPLPPGKGFESTRWSLVLNAGRADDTASREALSWLCQTYWYPLYAFVRRRGFGPHDAQDLTQAFFAHLLANHGLASVDPARGKFRSFLLASLRHFLANELERNQTQKRGGGHAHLPLDVNEAEARFGLELAGRSDPERAFDRNWALALMNQTFARLQAEQAAAGQADRFARLRDRLTGGQDAPPYETVAAQLGLSVDAVKMAMSRLRRRYGELLREEILHTVSGPQEAEEELRHLFAAVSG